MPIPALVAALAPAVVGAVGQGVASGIGAGAAAGDRARQMEMLKGILAEYGDIDLPTLEAIVAEQMGPSAQEGVRGQMDPRLRSEQMASLNTLGQFADTGDTATSKAAMHKILGDVARQEGAGRNAIAQNMRARGVSGGGAELAMQLQNQQASADRAQSAGLDQAAAAQKRMLEAVMQKGHMAGQMRSQDYGELSDAARAKDMISRYNADSRSRAAYQNNSLSQRNFGNHLALNGAKSNAVNGVANMYGANAAASAQTGAGIGQAINEGASTLGEEWQKRHGSGGGK